MTGDHTVISGLLVNTTLFSLGQCRTQRASNDQRKIINIWVASGAMVRALALYSEDPGSNLGLLNSLLNLIQFKKN